VTRPGQGQKGTLSPLRARAPWATSRPIPESVPHPQKLATEVWPQAVAHPLHPEPWVGREGKPAGPGVDISPEHESRELFVVQIGIPLLLIARLPG
jgi:hypothetical protein